MTQVHISGQDHTVTVNHDGAELDYVMGKTQKLWEDTKPPERPAGPAFGYSSEREQRSEGFAWDMGRGGQPVVKP